MWNFFKKENKTIFQLVSSQLAMTVFSLVVLLACNHFSQPLYYVASVLSVLMYLFLLYIPLWEKGSADLIKIEAGREQEDIFYGVKCWLFANILNLLLGLLHVILSFFSQDASGIVAIIFRFLNGMYLPLLSLQKPFLFLVVLIPSLVVCFVSYVLGIKGYPCLFPEKKEK